jgi:hypothetical protein
MAVAKKTTHYFVINQLGQSAHRHGAFESEEAAKTWVKAKYNFPCWLVPAEYIGNMPAQPLDADGNKIRPE